MSGNCDASLALRAIEGGAWSFIGKPVTSDVLKNLWQYTFQHKKSELREIEKAAWLALKSPGKALDIGNSNEAINKLTNHKEEIDPTKLGNQGSERSKRKSCTTEKGSDEYKEDNSEEKKDVAEENDCTTEKKKQMRATWTEIGERSKIPCLFILTCLPYANTQRSYHYFFCSSILSWGQYIGLWEDQYRRKLGQRKIQHIYPELMDEPALATKQVASHLQKYRLRVCNNEILTESEEQVYSRMTDRRPSSQHPNSFLYHGTKSPSLMSSQNPKALPVALTGLKNCHGHGISIFNDVHSQVCRQPVINTTELPAVLSNPGPDQNMDDLDDLLKGTSLDDSFYAQQFSDLDFEELSPGKASGGGGSHY
ncbi:hypothetical protein Sjap_024970 [Stephania japonica]|uniref:Response regulatory domain-containing protein n=1 Tax=Stephania japonica TaxID=461633 RepID=A0AAP0ELL4_9MAGN